MPNSPECQPIADTTAALDAQQQTKLAGFNELAEADKRDVLSQHGT